MSFRMLIAEGHPALRADLRALLEAEPDLEVAGEADNMRELLHLAGRLCPDIILLDVELPGLQGFEAIRQLCEALPNTQLLLLTDYLDAGLGRDALLAGAAGCVVSRAAASTLAVAARAVSQGQLYIQQSVVRALLADPLVRTVSSQQAGLTPRELDVLRLIAQGYTNRQVAEALALSVRTVESHRAKLMEKLDLHSRADLVRYAAGRLPIAPPNRPTHP